jgi:hypothetical protein
MLVPSDLSSTQLLRLDYLYTIRMVEFNQPNRRLATVRLHQAAFLRWGAVGAGLSKWGAGTLEKGVDIVVGTPGRVEQLISEKKCDISQIRFYVLDEVDGLISQGSACLRVGCGGGRGGGCGGCD